MRSCETASQSVTPISWPTWSLSASSVSIVSGGIELRYLRTALSCQLRTDCVLSVPVLLAQLFFQDLASSGLGKRFQKFHRARTLIVRQAPAAELQQFSLSSLRIRLQDNQRFRRFSPPWIGHGDHGHFVHAGVGQDRLLHFKRRNILAATDDDIFLAVH